MVNVTKMAYNHGSYGLVVIYHQKPKPLRKTTGIPGPIRYMGPWGMRSAYSIFSTSRNGMMPQILVHMKELLSRVLN